MQIQTDLSQICAQYQTAALTGEIRSVGPLTMERSPSSIFSMA
ncbi:MAG: hypothetical protein OJF47_003897 [Nitrospira sp.]|nr:MAG: hypothetical protein OJF47_003897 [Nitrospira sp.]